jgi:carboxypeptidase family protein
MAIRVFAAAALLTLLISTPAFSQSTFATITGTVEDATHAVVPGVTISATNTQTGVVTTALSNEAGAYNVVGLLPGTYKVTAALSGFQTETFSDVRLGNAERVRLNFSLNVAAAAQSVEVSIAADTLLATSSPSIGEVMPQQKIHRRKQRVEFLHAASGRTYE